MMRSSDLASVSIKRCLATPWAVPSFVKIDLLIAALIPLVFSGTSIISNCATHELTHCVTKKDNFVENKEEIKDKKLIMVDKKLHKSYTKIITCLETLIKTGVLKIATKN